MRISTNVKRLASAAKAAAMAIAILAISGVAVAQAMPPNPPPPGTNVFYARVGPLSPDDAMGFVGFEAGLGGSTVTGAPFTATFSQETTQTLADGNVIQRTTSGTLARDSNGRTRRDMTLPAIGPWATSGKTPPHVVFINDPVANVSYILDLDRKTARKMPQPKWHGKPAQAPPSPRFQELQSETTTTSLGTQTMNGLTVEGTKTTRTIPAGAIGNQKPIVVSVERWYSSLLQMNVLIKRSDPRTGENVFQLTNIQQGEPAASLFEAPSDYTVKQGGRNFIFRQKGTTIGPPPGAPPLPPPQN